MRERERQSLARRLRANDYRRAIGAPTRARERLSPSHVLDSFGALCTCSSAIIAYRDDSLCESIYNSEGSFPSCRRVHSDSNACGPFDVGLHPTPYLTA
jgi:hypothetical protein